MVGQTGCDERGVSQVMGIVILVAITVILVGATAAYMTNVGDQNEQPAPQFSSETEFQPSFRANGQYLNITHRSGATLDTDDLYIDVEGARVHTPSGTAGVASYEGNIIQTQVGAEFGASETLSLNRTAFVEKASGDPLTGSEYVDLTEATVRIVWRAEDGSRTDIIYECNVGYPACRGG